MSDYVLSDDEENYQGGVPIDTPDQVPAHLVSTATYDGYTIAPQRQPRGPPDTLLLQEYEGFARFLKERASPHHNRVTAGGRIVPAGPKSPPPTFRMDFLEKVLESAAQARNQNEAASTSTGWYHQEAYPKQHGVASDRCPRPGDVATESHSEKMQQEDPSQAIAVGLLTLPKGFEVIELITPESAVVKLGKLTLLATLNNEKISYQTIELVHPEGQLPSIASRVSPCAQQRMQFQSETHAPHLPPLYHGVDGTSGMQFHPQYQTHAIVPGQQIGPVHGARMMAIPGYHAQLPHGINPGATDSFSSLDRGSNGLATNQQVPMHGLFVPAGNISLIEPDLLSQLRVVTAAYEKMKTELTNLERFQALHDLNMPEQELGASMVQKRQMVLDLDILRRSKQDLEYQQSHRPSKLTKESSMGFRSGINGGLGIGAMTPPSSGTNTISASEFPVSNSLNGGQGTILEPRVKTTALSPSAPTFVPSGMTPTGNAAQGSPFHTPGPDRFENNWTPTGLEDAGNTEAGGASAAPSAAEGQDSWPASPRTNPDEWVSQTANAQGSADFDYGMSDSEIIRKWNEPGQGDIEKEELERERREAQLREDATELGTQGNVAQIPEEILPEGEACQAHDEMRAIRIEEFEAQERFRLLRQKRESAERHVRAVEGTFARMAQPYETPKAYAERCGYQRQLIKDMMDNAAAEEARGRAEVDDLRMSNLEKAPFAGRTLQGQHSQSLKSRYSIAAPVYHASGKTIPNPAARQAFSAISASMRGDILPKLPPSLNHSHSHNNLCTRLDGPPKLSVWEDPKLRNRTTIPANTFRFPSRKDVSMYQSFVPYFDDAYMESTRVRNLNIRNANAGNAHERGMDGRKRMDRQRQADF